MKNHLLDLNKLFLINLFLFLLISGCKKEDYRYYTEADRTIKISDNIVIDNGFVIKNPVFNISKCDDFLKYISSSDHFLIVPLKDFEKTTSTDKVVLSLRYDIDANINAAIKFAYRLHKYGLKSTYFILHTADYYGKITGSSFQRNPQIIYYLRKIQNDFGHEIGFHNDLVTLQIVYGISPKEFLKNELAYLRGNKINIVGTAYHGSPYCYIYKYYNAYFWNEYPDNGWNYEYVTKNNVSIKIEKDDLSNYNFEYEGGLMGQDYFFADCFFIKGKRWNPNMVNLDTIKKGKKVIILFHPELWD